MTRGNLVVVKCHAKERAGNVAGAPTPFIVSYPIADLSSSGYRSMNEKTTGSQIKAKNLQLRSCCGIRSRENL